MILVIQNNAFIAFFDLAMRKTECKVNPDSRVVGKDSAATRDTTIA